MTVYGIQVPLSTLGFSCTRHINRKLFTSRKEARKYGKKKYGTNLLFRVVSFEMACDQEHCPLN